MLEQMNLELALPQFALLISTLIKWLKSAGCLFTFQSDKSQVLDASWVVKFPGYDIPNKWLRNWQMYMEEVTTATQDQDLHNPS
ncbi:hypothetical protein VMCG_06295 [Cytospora schulzeri]|uniref:Uncharacterized protein n=1 Tax=Cytospora schulzeri TaxID=448051 RepID=A0A423W833_9PEZI|nr:hypothetical protein VMCG_06295 [Valsa malicola]